MIRRWPFLLLLLPLFLLILDPVHSCQTSVKTTSLVKPGIEVLAQRQFDALTNKRVGLITNHTGRTRSGESTIDVLFQQKTFRLISLFSPEHGIRGDSDESVDSGKDEKTGLPIHSLYGKNYKPTPAMLSDLDVLVFDIQDIGTRFYTYIGTLALAMKAAQENGKAFVVLDRPNPVGGEKVEGAVPQGSFCSGITCIHPIPTRHGMTIGELALLFNSHFGINSDLTVIPMEGWSRSLYFDQTGLTWVNPSPNMKTLTGAILYPGLGIAETTSLSVGRGTEQPFEVYGAPYVNPKKVLEHLNRRSYSGLRFEEVSFIPTAPYHPYKGQRCYGVRATITDRDALDSITAGLWMVQAFYLAHPKEYVAYEGFKTEVGDAQAWKMLTVQKLSPDRIVEGWQKALEEFKLVRGRYLLYP